MTLSNETKRKLAKPARARPNEAVENALKRELAEVKAERDKLKRECEALKDATFVISKLLFDKMEASQ